MRPVPSALHMATSASKSISKLALERCSSKAAFHISYATAPIIPSAKKVRDLTSHVISGAVTKKTTATWAQSYISAVSYCCHAP